MLQRPGDGQQQLPAKATLERRALTSNVLLDQGCAFCSVEVPGDQMIGRQPMDVHKELSPSCPLITGRDTTNRSMGQFWQTGGQEYVQRFHEDPERQVVHCKPSEQPEHPKDGPGVGLHLQPERTESPSFTSASPTQNHEAQNSLSHPAANTPQLPGPVMLEPQSLPTAVNTDGHQSWAPSLQQIPEPVSLPAQSSSPPQQQATPHTFASHTARPEPITRSTSHQIPQPEPQAQTTESTAASDGQEVPAAQGHGQSTAPQGPQSSQPTPSESSPSENPPPSSDPPRQVVTYAQLGIFTQQPKRQDMVVGATRCNTFSGWPHAETHTPDEMSDAGFYYTGHGDLVRCFYCKGGLKSWAEHLRPWVEHARFFPECPYVSQVKGHLYVEVVKELHEKQERVSEEEVERELEKRCRVPNQQQKELENEIQDAKEERMCKICQSNEVSILFLPCGHLVSCAQCAPALRTCAICRQRVKGRVRVYMDEEEG
ncbi:hypothetical protein BaRGS_00019792 [Batillaria attramentaria]|uniref:RING-type domain-containing protein n=1 Tax=Batillaria attramentaria TaxID=370345 RepID=A0ABD0KPG6_9CAEN